jgi:hypothetical protein
MNQKEKMQSLGDKAYEVFMQHWHIDATLYQIICNEKHCLYHLYSRRRNEQNAYNICPTAYGDIVHDMRREYGYVYVYRPGNADGWTDRARDERRLRRKIVKYCRRKLAQRNCKPIPIDRKYAVSSTAGTQICFYRLAQLLKKH